MRQIETPRGTFTRAFWLEVSKAILHWPSVLFVVCLSALASTKSSYGFLDFKAKELIALIFPISGTIVALALPAAQLSMELVARAVKDGIKLLTEAADVDDHIEYVRSEALKYRENLEPAWRAVVYALVSFLVSVIGSLGLFPGTELADITATLSLGLLVVSAIWFYPTVKFAFNLEGIDLIIGISDSLRHSARPEVKAAAPNQAAPVDQKAPLSDR